MKTFSFLVLKSTFELFIILNLRFEFFPKSGKDPKARWESQMEEHIGELISTSEVLFDPLSGGGSWKFNFLGTFNTCVLDTWYILGLNMQHAGHLYFGLYIIVAVKLD